MLFESVDISYFRCLLGMLDELKIIQNVVNTAAAMAI
jgi:hypothetical protein